KIFRNRIKEIHEKFKSKNVLLIDDTSNFFGLESLGAWKVRGNGVLLLTEKELFFGMWKPKKELLITIESIIKVTNPKSHMQRSAFRPLLKVIFKNENGDIDSAAWFVQKLDMWNDVFNNLILKNR
ncbi:MAG: hypothetical protein ACFFB6_00530, partial [Promethearchaeota archaeon]